ncbi:ring-cleaving dioxygenase [Agrilactobacillus fermenti]|uniref:ring-cleaving dioxygenase n=1 Tax=Agrilactobacillus fermenti TaxID=2586909 RepID=UPI001E4E3209|nr:ring-cleaving dioxygenase [Agrilactobacillus fermenti]MCD2256115.1 ring-cleaving dioxygenase [Agrilactobacillus fermenti]
MNTKLTGLHHLTAITSSSPKIFDFMAGILGLHLIKKTVNQDDVRTYHLYFTDDMGSAGTDITFFDFPGINQAVHGTNEINRTSFRVPNDAALDYWIARFDEFKVRHGEISERFGAKILSFNDFDGQNYQLISDETNTGIPGGTPYRFSPVPAEFAITGLGPEYITTDNLDMLSNVLTGLLGFTKKATEGQFTLYELHDNGHGAQVILDHQRLLNQAIQGFGGVHHLAFRTDDEESLNYWIQRISDLGFNNSGFVDRFYFKSEYFRPVPGILFEIATDGPGFLLDETYEEAGVHLELPPFLEEYRASIEANLVPFNTVPNSPEAQQ